MQEVKAIICVRRGTFNEWTAANPVLKQGELAVITDGNHKGQYKIGDGFTPFNGLPFSPRTAENDVLGLVAGSTANYRGAADANGVLSINGLEEKFQDLDEKDDELDDQINAMKGGFILIGDVGKTTDELKSMTDNDRYALLTETAEAIRANLIHGYALKDMGETDLPDRFHYWIYNGDETWGDMGERGDVSPATDMSLGIVKGSTDSLKIHIDSVTAEMSLNGLDEELDKRVDKNFAGDTADYVVGDIVATTKTNTIVSIDKKALCVKDGSAKEYTLDIKSSDNTVVGTLSAISDNTFELDVKAKVYDIDYDQLSAAVLRELRTPFLRGIDVDGVLTTVKINNDRTDLYVIEVNSDDNIVRSFFIANRKAVIDEADRKLYKYYISTQSNSGDPFDDDLAILDLQNGSLSNNFYRVTAYGEQRTLFNGEELLGIGE